MCASDRWLPESRLSFASTIADHTSKAGLSISLTLRRKPWVCQTRGRCACRLNVDRLLWAVFCPTRTGPGGTLGCARRRPAPGHEASLPPRSLGRSNVGSRQANGLLMSQRCISHHRPLQPDTVNHSVGEPRQMLPRKVPDTDNWFGLTLPAHTGLIGGAEHAAGPLSPPTRFRSVASDALTHQAH